MGDWGLGLTWVECEWGGREYGMVLEEAGLVSG